MTAPFKNPHPEDVKASIRKTGATLVSVAVDAGLAPATLSICLRRAVPSANRAIADHLGVPVHKLWPEWFAEDGSLLPRPRKGEANTAGSRATRQKALSA